MGQNYWGQILILMTYIMDFRVLISDLRLF